MDRRLDVAVVGAGVIGCDRARARGAEARALPSSSAAGIGAGAPGSSPAACAAVGTPIACRLARESAAFYADADDAWQRRSARLPSLRLPVPRARRGGARAAGGERRRAAREGIPSRIVSPRRPPARSGLETATVAGGAWCAEDGYFDARSPWSRRSARADVRIEEVAHCRSSTPARSSSPPAPTRLAPARAADRREDRWLSTRIRSPSGCSIRCRLGRARASPRAARQRARARE